MRAIDYALDLHSPVLHVALAIEAAEAASISDLAASYSHPIPSDLERVMRAEKCSTKADAVRAIIAEVITQLQRRGKEGALQIVESDGKWRFADGVTFESLRWRGVAIKRPAPDIHARLHDPFNPNTGAWSENIREFSKGKDLDELRESMREFGWLSELPAIADERGVVIIGHRRMVVAKELGIEPVIRKIEFGAGDAADARRAKLALVSNLGGKSLTGKDQEKLAEYLYESRDWSIKKVAIALNISQTKTQRLLKDVKKRPRVREGGHGWNMHPNTQALISEWKEAPEVPLKLLAKKHDVKYRTAWDIVNRVKNVGAPKKDHDLDKLEASETQPETKARAIVHDKIALGEPFRQVDVANESGVNRGVVSRAVAQETAINSAKSLVRQAADALDILARRFAEEAVIVTALIEARMRILEHEAARLAIAAQEHYQDVDGESAVIA